MKTYYPSQNDSICAPINEIHCCPICKRPFLEPPERSSLIHYTYICPHCKEQEKDFFFYWMNYRPLLEKEMIYDNDNDLALELNGEYVYGAFRAGDGSWDYNLFDEGGTLLDSGQIGDEWLSYADALSDVLKCNHITACDYKEIPWLAYSLLLDARGI